MPCGRGGHVPYSTSECLGALPITVVVPSANADSGFRSQNTQTRLLMYVVLGSGSH